MRVGQPPDQRCSDLYGMPIFSRFVASAMLGEDYAEAFAFATVANLSRVPWITGHMKTA